MRSRCASSGAAEGDPAILSLSPAVEHLVIENRVRTVGGGERKIHFTRMPGSHELRIWGTIPLGDAGTKELVAVDDPALFAAHALKDALEDRGIVVRGQAAAKHREEDDPVVAGAESMLADLASQPLLEVLRVLAKESQNLHTELVLREWRG
jgi:D-alanyl-D-alanine carboxypeptidase (penicillin-binding protein 4)